MTTHKPNTDGRGAQRGPFSEADTIEMLRKVLSDAGPAGISDDAAKLCVKLMKENAVNRATYELLVSGVITAEWDGNDFILQKRTPQNPQRRP